MKQYPDDIVETAWARPSNGPGWHNQPLWMLIRRRTTGELRVECVQPHEQTGEMLLVYKAAAAMNELLTDAAVSLLQKRAKDEREEDNPG